MIHRQRTTRAAALQVCVAAEADVRTAFLMGCWLRGLGYYFVTPRKLAGTPPSANGDI